MFAILLAFTFVFSFAMMSWYSGDYKAHSNTFALISTFCFFVAAMTGLVTLMNSMSTDREYREFKYQQLKKACSSGNTRGCQEHIEEVGSDRKELLLLLYKTKTGKDLTYRIK